MKKSINNTIPVGLSFKVPEFSNYYITEDGEVFSITKKGKTRKKVIHLDKDSYPRVVLFESGKRFDLCIHIISAMTFIQGGFIPKGIEVDHLDSDKSNTHYKNFEIVTKRVNCLRSIESSKNAKLSYSAACNMRTLRKTLNYSAEKLSIMFNVSVTAVYNVLSNKSYKDSFHQESPCN